MSETRRHHRRRRGTGFRPDPETVALVSAWLDLTDKVVVMLASPDVDADEIAAAVESGTEPIFERHGENSRVGEVIASLALAENVLRHRGTLGNVYQSLLDATGHLNDDIAGAATELTVAVLADAAGMGGAAKACLELVCDELHIEAGVAVGAVWQMLCQLGAQAGVGATICLTDNEP